MSLGVLRAAPPWHMSPHSLPLRKAICQARAHGKFHVPAGGDAIESFIHYVEAQPGNKLPVHPAYLEARRILAQSSAQFVGESLLKSAQAKLAYSGSDPALPTPESVTDGTAAVTDAAPRVGPGRTVQPAGAAATLPPRRHAATKA